MGWARRVTTRAWLGRVNVLTTRVSWLQGDLTKTTYRSALSTIPELYRKGGLGLLYKGGLARTGRLCGAFFIVNTLRDYAMRYKASVAGADDENPEAVAAAGVGFFGR